VPVSLPPTAPQTNDPVNFATEADAWVAYWETASVELNTLETNVNGKEASATTSAATATTQAGNAATSATAAQTALAAAQALPITPATSLTNLTIANSGSKTGTLVEAGKAFGIGNFVKWTDTANIANWMIGTISAFNPTTKIMTFTVDSAGGVGNSSSSWQVVLWSQGATHVADIVDYESDQATKKAVIEGDITAVANRVTKLEGGLETPQAVAIVAGAITIDLSADHTDFKITTSANITSMTFTNPPASGTLKKFQMRFAMGGVARTISWSAAVKHAAGTPVFSYTNGKEAVISLYTDDGGTKYHAFFVGESG
jgi:hypothetical protein